MIGALWAVAKNTFTETIRQPAYAVLLVVGMFLIGISPLLAMFTMMEDVHMVIGMGLATIFLVGLALSVLSASSVISREIRAKTAASVMSKPVGRVGFVLSKYAGVLAAQLVAVYLLGLILIFTRRMGVPENVGFKPDVPVLIAQLGPLLIAIVYGVYANYFHHSVFTSTAVLLSVPCYTAGLGFLCLVSKGWKREWIAVTFRVFNCGQLAVAILLVFLGVAVLAAIAVALSTRFQPVANVSICAGVFFLGMISDYVFGRFAAANFIARICYWIVPNLQAFWVSDQLMWPNPYIPWSYVGVTALYAAALIAAVLCIATLLFEGRELV